MMRRTDNVTGKVTSYVTYDDWGELTMKAILKMGVRQLDLVTEYTGYMYDQVLSAYYAKARMYDASNRRFMAVDPVKGTVSDPQTMVQYTYCLDNPVKYVDPLGLAVTKWDEENLDPEEIQKIQDATDAWNKANAKGDEAAKKAAHAAAEAVRNDHRTGTERGTGDGNTIGIPAPKEDPPIPPKPEVLEDIPDVVYEVIAEAVYSTSYDELISWAEDAGGDWAEMAKIIINAGTELAKLAALNQLKQKMVIDKARKEINSNYTKINYTLLAMASYNGNTTVNDGGGSKNTGYSVMLDYIVDKNGGTKKSSTDKYGNLVVTVTVGNKTVTYTKVDGIRLVDGLLRIDNKILMNKSGLGLTEAQSTHLPGDLFDSQEDLELAAIIMGYLEEGSYVDKVTRQKDDIKYSFLVEPDRPDNLKQYDGKVTLTENNLTSYYFDTEEDAVRAFGAIYGGEKTENDRTEYGVSVYRYNDGSFALSKVSQGEKDANSVHIETITQNTVAIVHTHPNGSNFTYPSEDPNKKKRGDDYGQYMIIAYLKDFAMERAYVIAPNGDVIVSKRISPDEQIPNGWIEGEKGDYGIHKTSGDYYTIGKKLPD